MITGDASCGKSRILERYVYNRFSDKSPPTIGVEFIPKNVVLNDGNRVRLQLWDTGKLTLWINTQIPLIAGSERYRAITTGHYRNAVGAILVFDVTSEESFLNLPYWLDSLKEMGDEHIVVVLVPSKCDIMFKRPELREVMPEQGKLFAKENHIMYTDECSALADIGI